MDVRRLDVPPAEVELCNSDKAFDGIVYFGNGQHELRVCHEAGAVSRSQVISGGVPYFVILSSMERGSRMKVGKVTLPRSAPGRS